MFIEILIIGIIVGGFRNGRLSNIAEMNIRGWYFIILSLILSLVPVFLNGLEIMKDIQVFLFFGSMILILLVTIFNFDKKGVWLIFLGGLFNVGIMFFNGFRMPVMMDKLKDAGLNSLYEGIVDGSIATYVASSTTGIMQVFTKFIAIPKPYPLPKMMTIGDIIMSLGLLWLIIGEMNRPSYYGKGRMVQYSYGSMFKKR